MWIIAAIAIIVVAARFYVRYAYLNKIRMDDWLMLTSLVCAVLCTSLNTVAILRGLGRHKQFLNSLQIAEATKWSYLAQPIGILAAAIGRLSVAYLLVSILPRHQKGQRIFLYGIGYSHVVMTFGMVIFIYAQCHPINAYWNRELGTCLDPNGRRYFGYFLGSYCSFIDLTLALFPISIFWNLQLKLGLKVFLCIIMGLGVVAMVASIVKTVELGKLSHTKDSTYDTSYILIWYALEMYLVIIAASIPTLNPLSLARSKFISPQGTNSGFSWRRLFKSRTSTDRSHTDDENKLPKSPHTPLSHKPNYNIHTTMLHHKDNDAVERGIPPDRRRLEGIHKTTEFAVGYADKFSMGKQAHLKSQREFEMV
ncbi:hypothetical protein EYC84_009290 [Monilinia fructicola]|uniref:Rhodopsin domain-containing protein n=1 Tax=Monilinia fructicola TaxID=38448 RepID=A0A5M9JA38_MONFR|nr:hypothetical protein EYC84_009290 [Monilinia fructicola]